MHNGELAKKTKFHLQHEKNVQQNYRCDASAKQMFRTWMKTFLHCGFGSTQVEQMTYEPLHSAQAQSVRVNEKISVGFVSHHCRDITRSEDKCIFYPYFRVKSLRFEL